MSETLIFFRIQPNGQKLVKLNCFRLARTKAVKASHQDDMNTGLPGTPSKRGPQDEGAGHVMDDAINGHEWGLIGCSAARSNSIRLHPTGAW